jgi:hypothetical protein
MLWQTTLRRLVEFARRDLADLIGKAVLLAQASPP